MNKFVLVLTLLTSTAVFAFSDEYPLVSCSSIDHQNTQIGTKCITTKGVIFERVKHTNLGEAWMGPDGLIWGQTLKRRYIQSDAVALCNQLGVSLPTREDFERADTYGFREVLPGIQNWFWTSSASSPNYGFQYSGFFGYIQSGAIEQPGPVRCVEFNR